MSSIQVQQAVELVRQAHFKRSKEIRQQLDSIRAGSVPRPVAGVVEGLRYEVEQREALLLRWDEVKQAPKLAIAKLLEAIRKEERSCLYGLEDEDPRVNQARKERSFALAREMSFQIEHLVQEL